MALKNGEMRNDISPELLVVNRDKGCDEIFVVGPKANSDGKAVSIERKAV